MRDLVFTYLVRKREVNDIHQGHIIKYVSYKELSLHTQTHTYIYMHTPNNLHHP